MNVWINPGEIPPGVSVTDADGDGLITLYDVNDAENAGCAADTNQYEYIDADDLLEPVNLIGGVNYGGWEDGLDNDANNLPDDIAGWNYEDVAWPHEGDNDPGIGGHGSVVASYAGAVINNGVGMAGVAGDTQIMALRMTTFDGDPTYVSSRARCFEYAVDNGAHIVNVSSGGMPTQVGTEAFYTYRNAVNYMYSHGVMHFNSVANKNEELAPDPEQPYKSILAYPQTLYVAASDAWDRKWTDGENDGSNFGHGVDISAPGHATSYSTPAAAGVGALVRSVNPDWPRDSATRDKLAAILLGTADDLEPLNAHFAKTRKTYGVELPSGLDRMLGSGRANARKAVEAAAEFAQTGQTPSTLPPAQIDRWLDGDFSGTEDDVTGLTLRLDGVFKGPHFTINKLGEVTGLTRSPVDETANWKLVADGDLQQPGFQPGGVEKTLNLDFVGSEYAGISYQGADVGYMIGLNELEFSFDALADGYYRLTAYAYDQATRPDGLCDPFGRAMDGNGNGLPGGDFVRDFYVGSRTELSFSADDDPQGGAGGDDSADSFLIRPKAGSPEYIEIYINGDDPGHLFKTTLLMEHDEITINGSSDDDTVTIERLPLAKELRGNRIGYLAYEDIEGYVPPPYEWGKPEDRERVTATFINVIGNGGIDTATVQGSHYDDTYWPGQTEAKLLTRDFTLIAEDFAQLDVETFGDLGTVYLTYESGDNLDAEDDQISLSRAGWSTTATGFRTVFVATEDTPPAIGDDIEFDLFFTDQSNVYYSDRKGGYGEGMPARWWDATFWYDNNDWSHWYNAVGERILDPYPLDPPGADDDAVIESDRVAVAVEWPAETLEIKDLWIVSAGSVSVDLANLSVGNDLTIVHGSLTSVNADYPVTVGRNMTVKDNGLVNIKSDLTISGSLLVGDASRIDLSTSLTAQGNVELADDARIDVGADCNLSNSGEHVWHLGNQRMARIDAEGNVDLGSSSELSFVVYGGDEMFTAGTYTLIEAAARSGQFDLQNLQNYLTAGGLTYSADKVKAEFLYDLHPGDANLDAATDVRDFNIWNANKFTVGTAWTQGDFNGDTVTDVRDFIIWNAHKFTSAGGGGEAAAGGGGSATASVAPEDSTGGDAVPTAGLDYIEVVYLADYGQMWLDTEDVNLMSLIIEGPPATTIEHWQNGTYQDGAFWTQQYFAGAEQWAATGGGPADQGVYFLATYPTGLSEADFGPVEYTNYGEILYCNVWVFGGGQSATGGESQIPAFLLERAAVDGALASELVEPTTEQLELLLAEMARAWQQGQESLGQDPAEAQALVEATMAQLLATEWS